MIELWGFFSIFAHLLVISILKANCEMENTKQHNQVIYNTFADVIDWDDLTEKDHQVVEDLKENGINITPTTIIKDLSGFPIGQATYAGKGIFASKRLPPV